jgi:flagellar biosynthesis protein FlhA
LRAHSSDTIVLAINELPDNRPIEVVASLGGNQQLTTQEE